MLCELELVQIFSEGLSQLGVPGFRIMMNDRRVLKALANASGVSDAQFTEWTTAVDKLDKIGLDGVAGEFQERGIPASAGEQLKTLVAMRSEADVKTGLASMEAMLQTDGEGLAALNSLKTMVEQAHDSGVPASQLCFDRSSPGAWITTRARFLKWWWTTLPWEAFAVEDDTTTSRAYLVGQA